GAIALVIRAAHAEEARAASAVIAPQHPVTGHDFGYVLADFPDGTNELVADREAGLHLHAAVVDVQIRATDPAGLDRDDGVVAGFEARVGGVVGGAPARGPTGG